MIQTIELPVLHATIIAIVLPILLVCLSILLVPILRDGSASRLRRYLSYLVNPPEDDIDSSSARKDRVRIFFYYIGIILFLTSFVIGEFYEVILDLTLPITQSSTGDIREAVAIVFQSPFNAGWFGSLPWIGLDMYHETWHWIYVTGAITDNPGFLSQVNETLIVSSMGLGLVFLIPLLIKRIRHSFLPSMFFFMTSMAILTKAAISSFAYAVVLAYGGVELEYISFTATGAMISGLTSFIVVLLLLVLAMFGLFTFLGRRLWKIFYSDSRSRNWFTVYLALSFWMTLVLTILVV
jgi:hypothetical protein